MTTIIDLQGNNLSTQQSTYGDLWDIFISIGQMNKAMMYFTRKERRKFMSLNGERIKSIQKYLFDLRMEHQKTEKREDGKDYFVMENGLAVFKSPEDEAEFKRKWEEYMRFPMKILE